MRPARWMTVDTAAATDAASVTSSWQQLHAGDRLGALRVAAGAEDLEALRREYVGHGPADSRGDAGNQHYGRSLCHVYS